MIDKRRIKPNKVDQTINRDAEWESVGGHAKDLSPEAEADLGEILQSVFKTVHPSILDLEGPQPSWVYLFLERYSQTANVMESCRYAKVSRQMVVKRKNQNPGFAKAMEDAGRDAADVLMLIAWNRAAMYSDSLLIQLLRAHFPEKFKQDAPPPSLVSIQLQPYSYEAAIEGIVSEEQDTDSAD